MSKGIKDVTLVELLTLTQSELKTYLISHLPQDDMSVEEGALIVVPKRRKEEIFRPMLCSHMDTVAFSPPKAYEIQTVGDTLMLAKWSKARCLGGDDRAGVFIMLQIIASEQYNKYTYGFFEDEERGCIGASAYTITDSFSDVCHSTSVFIGIDRQCEPGKPEIAQYGYDCDELDKVLSELLPEYSLEIGSMSDCSTLSEYSPEDIPCINITAGYIHEHTAKETIHIPSMMKTLEDLLTLELPSQPFEYVYTLPSWYRGGAYSGNYITRSWNSTTGVEDEIEGVAPAILCDQCGAHTVLYEDPMLLGYLCRECLDPNILTMDDFVDYTEEDN